MKILYSHLNIGDFSFSAELKKSDYAFKELPEYAQVSIEQSKKFGDPYVITTEDLSDHQKDIEAFYLLCKERFPSFYNDPFWLLTLLRLYTLYLYVEKHNIDEFIHLEYDNLIYQDTNILSQLPPGIYFTQVGPQQASAGMVYCNSKQHLTKFIHRLQELIGKGESVVQQFTQIPHLSEMILIDLIKQHTTDIEYLPLLPKDKYFDTLQCVFDGASYGQYIGGTNIGNGPGWYGLHHYVGQALHNGSISVEFDIIPCITISEMRIPIFNLHIHSKRLKEFVP